MIAHAIGDWIYGNLYSTKTRFKYERKYQWGRLRITCGIKLNYLTDCRERGTDKKILGLINFQQIIAGA